MLRCNPVKQKLKEGKTVLMAFLCSHDAACAEILIRGGVDLIALDLEHNAFTDHEIVAIARAAASAGGSAVIRTTSKDPFLLSHYMDLGADGILSTVCRGLADARLVIDAVKYPPAGRRGIGQLSPAWNYGYLDGEISYADFMRHTNDNTLVITTLETPESLADAAAIAALPEIDSVQMGPLDLSAAMGFGGDGRADAVQQAIARTNEAILAAGAALGDFVPTPEHIPLLRAKGVQIQLLGSDTDLLRRAVAPFGAAKAALSAD